MLLMKTNAMKISKANQRYADVADVARQAEETIYAVFAVFDAIRTIFRVVADGDEVLIRRQIGGDGLNLLRIRKLDFDRSGQRIGAVEPIDDIGRAHRVLEVLESLVLRGEANVRNAVDTLEVRHNRIDSGLFRVVCDIGRDGDLVFDRRHGVVDDSSAHQEDADQ